MPPLLTKTNVLVISILAYSNYKADMLYHYWLIFFQPLKSLVTYYTSAHINPIFRIVEHIGMDHEQLTFISCGKEFLYLCLELTPFQDVIKVDYLLVIDAEFTMKHPLNRCRHCLKGVNDKIETLLIVKEKIIAPLIIVVC